MRKELVLWQVFRGINGVLDAGIGIFAGIRAWQGIKKARTSPSLF
jgi:hypothetical protein